MPFSANSLMKSVSRVTKASSMLKSNGGLVNCSRLRTNTLHWPISAMAAHIASSSEVSGGSNTCVSHEESQQSCERTRRRHRKIRHRGAWVLDNPTFPRSGASRPSYTPAGLDGRDIDQGFDLGLHHQRGRGCLNRIAAKPSRVVFATARLCARGSTSRNPATTNCSTLRLSCPSSMPPDAAAAMSKSISCSVSLAAMACW